MFSSDLRPFPSLWRLRMETALLSDFLSNFYPLSGAIPSLTILIEVAFRRRSGLSRTASGIDMLQTQSQIASTSSVTLRSSLAGKKTRRDMIEMRNSILGVKRATNAGTPLASAFCGRIGLTRAITVVLLLASKDGGSLDKKSHSCVANVALSTNREYPLKSRP